MSFIYGLAIFLVIFWLCHRFSIWSTLDDDRSQL